MYKCAKGFKALNAIGLEFTGGRVSPIFECENAKNEQFKRIEIDPSNTITKIGVVLNKLEQVHGITLKGESWGATYDIAKDESNPQWYKQEGTYENLKSIPPGMEIIGVRCSRYTCE